MPLNSSQFGRVRTAGHAQGPTLLLHKADAVVAEAFVVLRRRGGFLLALPPDAVPDDVLANASADGSYAGELGPSVILDATALRPRGATRWCRSSRCF